MGDVRRYHQPPGRALIHHVSETALLGRSVAANDMREDY